MDHNIINFNNANSRETYYTIHNVKQAHQYTKGKGVKVGVLDWLFGKEKHLDLYSGFVDVANTPDEIQNTEGHGYWMASVLKEIVAECEIYAINSIYYGDDKDNSDHQRILYLEKGIDWAIENGINILTYSHARFQLDCTERLFNILDKAHENGIITTFIHCDHKDNLWPYACMPFNNTEEFNRNPDYNIFHFDYNTLFLQNYYKYREAVERNDYINSGNMIPYFSFSSMSPVLGGFVALLLSISNDLTLVQIRSILNQTSYKITKRGVSWYDINPCDKVIDIGSAVRIVSKQI